LNRRQVFDRANDRAERCLRECVPKKMVADRDWEHAAFLRNELARPVDAFAPFSDMHQFTHTTQMLMTNCELKFGLSQVRWWPGHGP
jgi:hypothetical protein